MAMYSPNYGRSACHWDWMLSMALILTLVGCGGGQQDIIGKWEQITGNIGIIGSSGDIVEFFKDGTVSFGMLSGKYSWPDNTHLKIELNGLSFVYGAVLSGDDLTLADGNTQVGALKRYKALALTNKNIAGEWKYGGIDESSCVNSLGVSPIPDRMQFSEDGTFSIKGGHDTAMISFNTVNMNGQFSIKSDRIHIQASGTFGRSPVQGEIDCQIALSYSRLEFVSDQGKITRYHR